jgi:hypothetical protein
MTPAFATVETAAHAAMAMDSAAASDSSQPVEAARTPAPADREQAIREVAYAFFEARGGEPGHELDDWLKAEIQVEQATRQSASAGVAGQVAH